MQQSEPRAAASTSWRGWLLGAVGPICLGIAAVIIGIWNDSAWITVALVVGAVIGYFDPWDIKGVRRRG